MPDSAIPIYQTVSTTGEAKAEFEAIIKALGLSLTEKEFSEVANTIKWLEQVNGQQREFIVGRGSDAANNHLLNMGTTPLGGQGGAELLMGSAGTQGTVSVRTQNGFETQFATILGPLHQSTFLQVAGSSQYWRTNFGGQVSVGPGEEIRVSHGLGLTPAIVMLCPVFNTNVTYTAETPNTTTFGIKNFHPSFGAAFYWLVIG